MSEKQIELIKKSIKEYKEYLNNGQHKPQWRVEEVENYINVMNKVLENGTD